MPDCNHSELKTPHCPECGRAATDVMECTVSLSVGARLFQFYGAVREINWGRQLANGIYDPFTIQIQIDLAGPVETIDPSRAGE